MVTNRPIHSFKCATSKLAYDSPAGYPSNIPILFFLFILIHPAQSIAAETEADEDHGLDKEAQEDITISNNDVDAGLADEGLTISILHTLCGALLGHHGSAPDAQDQQN